MVRTTMMTGSWFQNGLKCRLRVALAAPAAQKSDMNIWPFRQGASMAPPGRWDILHFWMRAEP